MDILVGYSGFVGSNLLLQREFDTIVNSKNIKVAYNTNPDLLVYCGVPSEMFIANNDPKYDYYYIENAINNIKKINPNKIVLISTTSVYDGPGKNEDDTIDSSSLFPYGYNRLLLERWVRKKCKNYVIIRLPALYGVNLRKNFIYDYINRVPTYLKESDYLNLSSSSDIIKKTYNHVAAGFYRKDDGVEISVLKDEFKRVGFNTLKFTDSRSSYQFYPLSRLNEDIEYSLNNSIDIINLVTPPISIYDLYYFLTGEKFINHLNKTPVVNDIHTKWYPAGYIMDKNEELRSIKKYIDGVTGHE